MIPKEILKQVKHIEIRTNKLVNDIFGGEYESVFKGHGIEFADVREYVPGDDIRTIDWNVTARSQHPFVKQYVEERQLTVLFVVDASSSNYFGTTPKLKSEVTAEVSALLAFSAVKNNDRVGLLIYTEDVERYIPVKKGKRHALRVIRDILYYHPEGKKTSLKKALEYLHNVLTRRAVIFVISDFYDKGFEKPLKILSKKHDLIAIRVFDPVELELPKCGLLELEDAESGELRIVDCSDEKMRQEYQRRGKERVEKLDSLFKRIGIDKIEIDTSKSYIDPIMKFFWLRERRM